jgi:cephalosporin-C deacetylase
MKLTSVLILCAAALLSPAASADTPTTLTPISPLPPGATLRAATVRVIVVPDHRDWTYKLGEPARFAVTVTADNEPIDNITVTYTTGPDMFPGAKKTVPMPTTGLTVDAGTMTEPGFLRCIVTAEVAGVNYRGLATAAYAPADIKPTQTEPADFDAYWDRGQDRAREGPDRRAHDTHARFRARRRWTSTT